MPSPQAARGRQRTKFDATLEIPGVVTLGHYRYTAAQQHLNLHAHPGALEICFLARGQQTYRVANEVYRLQPGDQFVTFPNEMHDTANEPEARGQLYWLILNVQPDVHDFLGLSAANAAQLKRRLLALPTRHFRATLTAERLLERALRQARACLEARNDAPLERLGLSQTLVMYALETISAARDAPGSRISALIRANLEFISDHGFAPLSVEQLAQQTGLSESRFKTRFQLETGVPPAEYLLRRRVDEAARRLLYTNESVTDIALGLHFNSSQYFATAFKRFTGQSPTEYRAAASSTANLESR
jgi:AraC-like DNA-binding protein/quercetin dioxygenase-like cupin family protein